jgi:excisionase family DNA binding protein
MTVIKAAKRIGISASKLYQLTAARQIGHYRVGGKILFSEQDVAAFLETCRVGAAAPVAATPQPRIQLKHLKLHRIGA